MYSKSRSCIKVKEGLTHFIDLNLGVRQGDNLSPALFKIFINDLPKYLDGTKDPDDLGDLTINCLMMLSFCQLPRPDFKKNLISWKKFVQTGIFR